MTLAIAVEALDGDGGLILLLVRAVLGNMAHLVAVATLGNAEFDDLAGILKPLHVLLWGLGPKLSVARTGRVGPEAVSDGILLTQVTLEIHVREGCQVRLLNGDQPELQILGAECLLQIGKSRLRSGLGIGLNRLLNLRDATLLNGLKNGTPGVGEGHVLVLGAIKLASALTLGSAMA